MVIDDERIWGIEVALNAASHDGQLFGLGELPGVAPEGRCGHPALAGQCGIVQGDAVRLMVSDLVIIPTAPRSFDLWGVDHTRDLIEQVRVVHELRALVVLNGADANGSDNQSSLELLAAVAGIEVFPHVIGRRKAFSKAADEGLSVLEYIDAHNRPSSLQAREELTRLLDGAFPKIERMVACL